MRHGASRFHLDDALFLGGEQLHDRRLDNGHECHIGVSRYGNGAHEVRCKFRRKEDSRRAVGTTDNSDSTGLVGSKAEGKSNHISAEDAELSGSTDEHKFRIGNKRREVGHRTNTEEDERRIPSGTNSVVENIEDRTFFVYTNFETGIDFERDVAHEDTETNRNEEQGLEIVFDGKPNEEQTDSEHNEVFPSDVGKTRKAPEIG